MGPAGKGDILMRRNLSQLDRAVRATLGIGLGIVGILISSHSYVGRALGVAGALVILSGASGT